MGLVVQGVVGSGPIVIGGVSGIMMVVRIGRSGNGEQERRGRAVLRLLPGSTVVCLALLVLLLARLARELSGAALPAAAVCRVFVNVCEVRKWSGPGVAA